MLGGALLVRCLALPIWRHTYDGHEAEYLDLWMGTRELSQGGTMLYPAMQWLYRGLGFVAPVEHGPLLVSLAASLVSIAALHGLLLRLVDRRVAVAGAVALALCGTHAFWSSSAYNVILPHALVMVALWALAVLRRGDPLGAGLVAGGAAALAVATRLELAVVAPVGLLFVLALRPPGWRRWLPPILGGGALALAAALLVLLPGGQVAPGAGQRELALSVNLGLFDYFAPFDALWLAPVVLVAALLALRERPRLAGPLVLLVLGSHLLFVTFDDYGYRHLVTALAAICGLIGFLVRWRQTWPLYAVALFGLGWQTLDVGQRYYASEEAYGATLDPELPVRTSVGDCALINEDSRIVAEDRQLSHFNRLDPVEAEALRAERGCVQWLQTVQDHRWSSRSVRARALRLEHLYELTPVSVVRRDNGFVGLLLEVGERK